MFNHPMMHHEEDFNIEKTSDGLIHVRARGGASFVKIDPQTKSCTIDLLNFPYIDVGKRKADLEKKTSSSAATAAADSHTPKKKKPRKTVVVENVV